MKQKFFGCVSYFDILVSVTALAMASTRLTVAVADRPGWTWSDKDALGLGLLLGTTLAFVALRRRAPARSPLALRLGTAALTITAAVVLFRQSSWLWVGVGTLLFLFAISLRSQTLAAGLVREDIHHTLLVLGGILLAILFTEGTLRLIPDLLPEGARARVHMQVDVDQPWYVCEPYIGHLHNLEYLRLINAKDRIVGAWTPSRFDAWGFRNAEPWPARVDIIAVGDSLTYSMTVKDEQAWPALLEQALAPHRVLNLGLIGAAPQQYLRVYERFWANLSPKVLLVGVSLGNDLRDTLFFDAWLKDERHEGYMDFVLRRSRFGVNGWLRKSYLYTVFDDLRASYLSGMLIQGKTMQLPDGSRVQLVPRALASQVHLSAPTQPAFTLVLNTLAELCTLGTRQQAQCLVLLLPSKEGTYLPLRGGWPADPATRFIPELDKRGIAYLDLSPHFRQRAAAGESLFWEVDVHPNARGYTLIADVVLAYLREHAAKYGLN